MLWLELEAINSLVNGKANTELLQRKGDENFLLQARHRRFGCAKWSVFLPAESSEFVFGGCPVPGVITEHST